MCFQRDVSSPKEWGIVKDLYFLKRMYMWKCLLMLVSYKVMINNFLNWEQYNTNKTLYLSLKCFLCLIKFFFFLIKWNLFNRKFKMNIKVSCLLLVTSVVVRTHPGEISSVGQNRREFLKHHMMSKNGERRSPLGHRSDPSSPLGLVCTRLSSQTGSPVSPQRPPGATEDRTCWSVITLGRDFPSSSDDCGWPFPLDKNIHHSAGTLWLLCNL